VVSRRIQAHKLAAVLWQMLQQRGHWERCDACEVPEESTHSREQHLHPPPALRSAPRRAWAACVRVRKTMPRRTWAHLGQLLVAAALNAEPVVPHCRLQPVDEPFQTLQAQGAA
jgi:hypothetical protein